MKKIVIFSLALFLLSSVLSYSSPKEKGIEFQNITFNQALMKAKKEHKFVFMNVYAVWCGPCTQLKKTTFKSEKVGNTFNKNFVNISIDAEKGEGIELSRKYEVNAHPLMLVISPDGKIQKRILGFVNEDQLLKEMNSFIKR